MKKYKTKKFSKIEAEEPKKTPTVVMEKSISSEDEVVEVDQADIEQQKIEEMLEKLAEELDAKDPEKPSPIVIEELGDIPLVIPDHNDVWRAAVEARVQNKPFSSEGNVAVWERMLARASEILGVAQLAFDENCKALSFAAASAKSDVPKYQAVNCLKCFERISQVLRDRQVKETEFWKLMRNDDIEMLRALLKTRTMLQNTYAEEEKIIRQRAERRGAEVDQDFQPRQRLIQERLETVKKQSHAMLAKYGTEMQNLGPPLYASAMETIQALQVIQTIKKDSLLGEDVVAVVSCLHSSIQDMQDMIDQESPDIFYAEAEGGEPDDSKTAVATKIADLQVSLKEINEKIILATKQREELAMQLLSSWTQPTGFTDNIKKETDVRQEILDLEQSKKSLEHEISRIKGEESIALLEAKRRKAERIKQEHPKWVKLLKNLATISDQLAKDMEALHRDRIRAYSLIVSDTTREMDALAARQAAEMTKAVTLLTQNLLQKKTQRMMMWKSAVEPLDRFLVQESPVLIHQMISLLSTSDPSIATQASITKDSLGRLQSEITRYQSIKLYLSVLNNFQCAKDVF